jgi:predicted secreted protein
MVVIGGSGSYTDKFEVIGNVKASFVGSGALLTGITKSMVGYQV